ncbi:hypothetical protein V8G54_018504, partial [Vigna mungo]
FWRILNDEGSQLVSHINIGHKTTSSTFQLDHLVLSNYDIGFRISTTITLDILLDEILKKASKFCSIMSSIDVGSPSLLIKLRLGTKLTTKILSRVRSWPCQCLCNINHIDDISFDAITSALNFGNHLRHLVPIEGIIAVCSTNVL